MGTCPQLIKLFLIDSVLPVLKEQDTQQLELPITENKLIQAIKSLKPGQSPGPDSFTAHYYKAFPSLLISHLLKALNYLKDLRDIPEDFLRAHVTVLPKPNKDLLECFNYRPILLLNIDFKTLYKSPSKSPMTTIAPIDRSRTGRLHASCFMPGTEASDNVTKALNLIHRAHSDGFEGMLLSTDTEKAFDRILWDYLHVTCDYIGLKPHMLSWISTLYHNPTTRIKVNGTLSDTVLINNRITRVSSVTFTFHSYP